MAPLSRPQSNLSLSLIAILAISLCSCRSETKQAPPSAQPAKSSAATKTTEAPQAKSSPAAEQPPAASTEASAPTDFETILSTATTGEGQAQYTAIDDLGERHGFAATAVPALQKLLDSGDAQVRWRSARALGDYGELAQAAAPALRKLLGDKDPIVQYHAVASLGKIGDQSDATVDALVTAAANPDARIARTAIAALRHLKPGPERVMAALEKALRSDDSAVTVHAMDAIVALGDEAVPLLNAALQRPKTSYLACAAIEHIGPAAADTVPALTELLGKTSHSQLLIRALLALASIGPAAQSAAPQIIPLLDHATDATVPVAAAYALGSIGAADADGQLKQAAAKNDPFLQMVASWALAKIHPDNQELMKQAVDRLTGGLKGEDAAMRTAAAKGLEMLHAPPERVAPALMAVADDPDPRVVANAVSALAGLGEKIVPRAADALQKPEMRELAVKVLTRMGPKAAGAVEPIVAAMPGASPEFRTELQFALGAIGPDAAPATAALVESLDSENTGVRESALFALRELGPGAKAAVPTLIAKTEAGQSFDAMGAAWALSTIVPGDAEAAPKVMPVLIRGLSNAGEQIRLESAAMLGAWGPAAKPAAEILTKIAKQDSSPRVRAAAEAALKKISSGS